MEHRIGVDQMLNTPTTSSGPVAAAGVTETDGARIARQNREALKSWASLGVPVPVLE